MDFEVAEEHRMLKDLVQKFVRDELMPLEAAVMASEAEGRGLGIGAADHARLDARAHELGLFGLDAPEDVGGSDLPMLAMVGVEEEMGRCITPYTLPPDSPNLRMLMATVNERQRDAYLAPYVAGKTISAIGISEPGAGSDPAGMTTHAVRDGDDWVINGRKIWITRAAEADFTILMAVTDKVKGARGGMSAFLVDKGTPGFNILRRIPMLGGQYSYEIALEDCRVEGWKLLGQEGSGFAPMQVRLGTRRVQMAAWSVGMAQRALDMVIEYAPQRKTFGLPLSEDQWLFYFCFITMIVLYWAAANLLDSRSGRAMMAIRDQYMAADTMGIDTALYKTVTFGISAAYTGIAGALSASAIAFVAPDSFNIFLSIKFLIGLVVGGIGSLTGSVIGGIFYVLVDNSAQSLTQFIRNDLGLPFDLSAYTVFGVLLIAIIYLMPMGIAGGIYLAWRKLRSLRR